jgi:hypothetical protein
MRDLTYAMVLDSPFPATIPEPGYSRVLDILFLRPDTDCAQGGLTAVQHFQRLLKYSQITVFLFAGFEVQVLTGLRRG